LLGKGMAEEEPANFGNAERPVASAGLVRPEPVVAEDGEGDLSPHKKLPGIQPAVEQDEGGAATPSDDADADLVNGETEEDEMGANGTPLSLRESPHKVLPSIGGDSNDGDDGGGDNGGGGDDGSGGGGEGGDELPADELYLAAMEAEAARSAAATGDGDNEAALNAELGAAADSTQAAQLAQAAAAAPETSGGTEAEVSGGKGDESAAAATAAATTDAAAAADGAEGTEPAIAAATKTDAEMAPNLDRDAFDDVELNAVHRVFAAGLEDADAQADFNRASNPSVKTGPFNVPASSSAHSPTAAAPIVEAEASGSDLVAGWLSGGDGDSALVDGDGDTEADADAASADADADDNADDNANDDADAADVISNGETFKEARPKMLTEAGILKYYEKKGIMQLFQEMSSQLFEDLPDDPYQLMLDRLEIVKPDDRLDPELAPELAPDSAVTATSTADADAGTSVDQER